MLPSKRVIRTLPVQLSKTENLDFKKDVKFNSNSEETALLGFLNSLWNSPKRDIAKWCWAAASEEDIKGGL